MNGKIFSGKPEETEEFGYQIGMQLKGQEAIELIGDVGTGKTTFVRGLARGVGSSDRVSSPTFTVSKVYSSDNITLYHYDFYRLDDLEIIKQELAEVLQNKINSVVMEWASAIQPILPKEHITISIENGPDDTRYFSYFLPEKFKYIKIDS